MAEVNGAGRITVQYLYLGNRPVALVRNEKLFAIHSGRRGAPRAVSNPAGVIVWRASYSPFGAAQVNQDPDQNGKTFTLNLRLPGQYYDAETGNHYNRHRSYNPDTGRYLTPDPLGLAAGPNPYLYAANDPVNYIDPTGLLLFAFDGTNNADTDFGAGNGGLDQRTNVYQFREAYLGDPSETATDNNDHGAHWYYVTGAGRADPGSGITESTLDLAGGTKTAARVMAMTEYFYDYLNRLGELDAAGDPLPSSLNIDIVGFSRGAAEARIFANLLDSFLAGENRFEVIRNFDFLDGYESNAVAEFNRNAKARNARQFLDVNACFNVNLRFLGLWDTVPHLEVVQGDDAIEAAGDDGQAYLGIPASVHYAAHAVSVNENRANWSAWSIHANPGGNRAGRVELGFIGDHSNIGGAHADSDLGDIAFMWMIQQARRAGVAEAGIDYSVIGSKRWNVVRDTDLRDLVYAPTEDADFDVAKFFLQDTVYGPGREFYYLLPNQDGDPKAVAQKQWRGEGGMTYELSLEFMAENIYQDTPAGGGPNAGTDTRNVGSGGPAGNSFGFNDGLNQGSLTAQGDKVSYEQWLKDNYNLEIAINEVR